MEIKVEHVSPSIAESWLKLNIVNRPLQKTRVRRYAQDMLAGMWKLTHQAIAFDEKGNLIDGQHRLSAVVESGIDVDLMVARGCTADSFGVMDLGAPRTAGDVLSLDSIASPKPIAAIARNMMIYGELIKNPSIPAVRAYAMAHMTLINDFLHLAKSHTAACAAAFAFHESHGLPGVREAMDRLLECHFVAGDPMQVLAKELNELRGSIGGGSQQRRYSLADDCLRICSRSIRVRPTHDSIEASK